MMNVTLFQSFAAVRNLRQFGWMDELKEIFGTFKMVERQKMTGRGWEFSEYEIIPEKNLNATFTVTINHRRH